MKRFIKLLASLLALGVLSAGLAAQTTSASLNDSAIQARATQKLAAKQEFRNLRASAEDGIATLTGTVDLYQQKLDAAKAVRKLPNVQGVRNLIAVEGKNVPDADLTAQLDRKLYYDRIGYDNLFNYVAASVKDGVAVLNGETRTEFDRELRSIARRQHARRKRRCEQHPSFPGVELRRQHPDSRLACHLSRPDTRTLRKRSREAHPHRGRQWQADAVRHRREQNGQRDRRHTGKPDPRRL